MDKNTKIYVAGHHGLVGSAIWNNLQRRGYTNLVGRSHKAVSYTHLAMEMVLRVLGVGPGDEIIMPAYTYTASASVVQHVGATIVLSLIHIWMVQLTMVMMIHV